MHCGESTFIERHRLDQGEHAIAKAKRKLVNGLARRRCEKMAMPVEVNGDPGERPVGLDAGDGAGERGAHAQVLSRGFGERDPGDPR